MLVIYITIAVCLVMLIIVVRAALYLRESNAHERASRDAIGSAIATIKQDSLNLKQSVETTTRRIEELESEIGPVIESKTDPKESLHREAMLALINRILAITAQGEPGSAGRREQILHVLQALNSSNDSQRLLWASMLAATDHTTRPILAKAGQMSASMSPSIEWKQEDLGIAKGFWRNVEPRDNKPRASKEVSSSGITSWDDGLAPRAIG